MRYDVDDPEPAKKTGLPAWAILLILLFVVVPMGLAGLGVVASIAVPNLLAARLEVDVQTARRDLGVLREAAAVYAEVHQGEYPQSLEMLATPDDDGAAYLATTARLVDPWGNSYRYDPPGRFGRPEAWVYSFGVDGQPGGIGFEEDIALPVE